MNWKVDNFDCIRALVHSKRMKLKTNKSPTNTKKVNQNIYKYKNIYFCV